MEWAVSLNTIDKIVILKNDTKPRPEGDDNDPQVNFPCSIFHNFS